MFVNQISQTHTEIPEIYAFWFKLSMEVFNDRKRRASSFIYSSGGTFISEMEAALQGIRDIYLPNFMALGVEQNDIKSLEDELDQVRFDGHENDVIYRWHKLYGGQTNFGFFPDVGYQIGEHIGCILDSLEIMEDIKSSDYIIDFGDQQYSIEETKEHILVTRDELRDELRGVAISYINFLPLSIMEVGEKNGAMNYLDYDLKRAERLNMWIGLDLSGEIEVGRYKAEYILSMLDDPTVN